MRTDEGIHLKTGLIRRGKVLVTGGAGFIGSHLTESLIREGLETAVVDNLNPFYPRSLKQRNLDEIRRTGSFEFHEADICDLQAMRQIMERHRFDTIIHLAALAGVRPSIDDPISYEKVNVGGTTNLLQLAVEYKVRRFIFGSSSSVYGATSKVPFSEDHVEGRPISPYAATKLAGELLCYTYAHLFDLECVCLRFFTVYGPRQRPDLAIRKFTELIDASKPIPFFGDGTSGRDYTFVKDIVEGINAARRFDMRANRGASEAPFETFNLGNSSPITLSEMVKAIENVTGKEAALDRKPFQPGDVPITWASVEKAERLLHFRPQTPFSEGLKAFVEWHRSLNPSRNNDQ